MTLPVGSGDHRPNLNVLGQALIWCRRTFGTVVCMYVCMYESMYVCMYVGM